MAASIGLENKEQGNECIEVVGEASYSISRHGLMTAAILSGFSTFIPGILVNFGFEIHTAIKLFAILYLLGLPAVIAALYEVRSFANKVLPFCGAPPMDNVALVIGVLPLGLIVPLYYVESMLANYCKKLQGKIRVSAIDLFINLIVLGLHVIVFARIFNYIIDNIVPGLCSEE